MVPAFDYCKLQKILYIRTYNINLLQASFDK